VVCDGFVGNVLLKAAESMAELIVGMMREELVRSSRTRMGGWLVKPAFQNFSRRTDYSEYGAVPLLGVRGVCFIGHGRSNAKAIRSAIRSAAEFASRSWPEDRAKSRSCTLPRRVAPSRFRVA
jgi:glycerol-3-phosphate acyltransferase PlsX